MRQISNNDGTIFCTYNLPASIVANLPNDTQPYCTLAAFQAGELGFRFNNNGSTPTPTSHTSGTVYCSRSWNGDQAYSGGDCYFILPAKESFSCSGSGIFICDVHMVHTFRVSDMINHSFQIFAKQVTQKLLELMQ